MRNWEEENILDLEEIKEIENKIKNNQINGLIYYDEPRDVNIEFYPIRLFEGGIKILVIKKTERKTESLGLLELEDLEWFMKEFQKENLEIK